MLYFWCVQVLTIRSCARHGFREEYMSTINRFLLGLLSMLTIASCSNDDINSTKGNNNQDFSISGVIDGHQYVDLGLSVSWATCNIGATRINEQGNDYFWGDPTGTLSFATAKKYSFPNPPIKNTKYDIAKYKWGTNWSLPSLAEMRELSSKCTFIRSVLNGTDGYIVLGPNGNKIFIPIAKGHFCYASIPSESNIHEDDAKFNYMFEGDKGLTNKGTYSYDQAFEIGSNFSLYGSNNPSCLTFVVRPVTKYGATGYLDNNGNSNNNGNNGGTIGGTTTYEKPDIIYNSCTPYQTKLKVVYQIYNKEKTNVTSAKVYYGTTSKPTQSVSASVTSAQIIANISGLKKGTTYYVKCTATGKGGTSTTEVTKLMTQY